MKRPGGGTPAVRALATVNPVDTSFMRHFEPSPEEAARRAATRQWVPLDAISPLLVAAILRAEDNEFFAHRGVNWTATARTIAVRISGRNPFGGFSTLTQQLARNLYLTPARSVSRKLREMWLALRLDRALSKARTLEIYLNVVQWAIGVWGCSAASAHFFAREPHQLGPFESTLLAVLLPAPRVGLVGAHAARSHGKQLWLTYQLLLAGLAVPEECAVGCDRVRELHRRIAEGAPLGQAVASAMRLTDSPDARFLRDLATELGIARMPAPVVTAALASREQEQAVLARLRARCGEAAVQQVFATGRIDALRAVWHRPASSVDA